MSTKQIKGWTQVSEKRWVKKGVAKLTLRRNEMGVWHGEMSGSDVSPAVNGWTSAGEKTREAVERRARETAAAYGDSVGQVVVAS